MAKRSPAPAILGADTEREIADRLAGADADYATSDTAGGEDLRDRYGLE